MITVHDLSVAYASGHEVLHRLHCEIPFGAVTGIVGENGSGKSSFLHALVGLLPVPRSCFRVGEGVLDWRDIAFLPAEPYLYPSILAADYLRVFEADAGRLGLWEPLLGFPLKTPVSALSSGMRKRLALAGTVAFRRRVVVMDEPYNALDMESVFLLDRILSALRKAGCVVLLTSHLLEPLAAVSDQILLLQGGRFARRFTPGEYAHLGHALTAQAESRYDGILSQLLAEC